MFNFFSKKTIEEKLAELQLKEEEASRLFSSLNISISETGLTPKEWARQLHSAADQERKATLSLINFKKRHNIPLDYMDEIKQDLFNGKI